MQSCAEDLSKQQAIHLCEAPPSDLKKVTDELDHAIKAFRKRLPPSLHDEFDRIEVLFCLEKQLERDQDTAPGV
jgi:hypothetical protein